MTEHTIQCTTCRGSGRTESDDSTDDRIYKCWACDGTGRIADRRKPDPALQGAVRVERERIVARIRREACETFDIALDHEFRALANLIEREGGET